MTLQVRRKSSLQNAASLVASRAVSSTGILLGGWLETVCAMCHKSLALPFLVVAVAAMLLAQLSLFIAVILFELEEGDGWRCTAGRIFYVRRSVSPHKSIA